MKKDHQTSPANKFASGRDQQLRTELADLARNGTPEDRNVRRASAEADWSSARAYPLLMLGALLAMSAALSGICLSVGIASYVGVGAFALALIGAVVMLNGKHRQAYVNRQMANGMSRADAERDYINRYDGS
jgi:hypothetical protein